MSTRRARTLSTQAFALWEWLSRTRDHLGFAGVPVARCERIIAEAARRENEEARTLYGLVGELQAVGLVEWDCTVQGVIGVWVTDPARVAKAAGVEVSDEDDG